MTAEDRIEAEKKVAKIRETFKFNSASQGKQNLTKVKSPLVSTIIGNIEKRFEPLLQSDDMYSVFTIFDVSPWSDGEETDMLIERHNAYFNTLA